MIDSENIIFIIICLLIVFYFSNNKFVSAISFLIIGAALHSIYAHHTPDEDISIVDLLT